MADERAPYRLSGSGDDHYSVPREPMTPEECAARIEAIGAYADCPDAGAHLRRLASTETALHNLRGYVVGLEEEVKRLRAALEEYEYHYGRVVDLPAREALGGGDD